MSFDTLYDGSPAPRYKGVACRQQQADLDRYADLIWEFQPPWLFQAGIYEGGTMAFLADVMHEANPGSRCLFADTNLTLCRVTTRDLPNTEVYMTDAMAPSLGKVVSEFSAGEKGLVILGDAHHVRDQEAQKAQVLLELEMYAPLAGYLVVEGTVTHDRVSPGALLALWTWLRERTDFVQDADPEGTQHPGGWLRRIG